MSVACARSAITVFAIIAHCLAAIPGYAADPDWHDKIDPWVWNTARSGETEFLVVLEDQADLRRAAALKNKLEKGAYVYSRLSQRAERTQRPVIEHLDRLGAEYRTYWIVNMIWVRGGFDVMQAMALRDDIHHLYANPRVKLQTPLIEPNAVPNREPETIEWNIARVNADDVWALGINGEGVVVAGQDTGYMWNHPALVNQYRGSAGNHDYHWHDAIHSGGGVCGADSPQPCDDHGHGTHTMGTIVGDDGASNQIGMAPGARWIGCRNMDQGNGTPATYAECYQFFVAPTDLNDENADPSMAPHVINNSWSCPESEGCVEPNVLLAVVQNVRAAGIVTVHSAGNEGFSCSTVATPAAIYDESYSVGASDSSDSIASFSSRGPVTIDGSNRMKPDITAPGVNIRSSTFDGSYQSGWSGTSMAGPHVAGLVALLIDRKPALAGAVDLVEETINRNAVPLTTSQGCGGDGQNDVPNNVYGWGRIDALAAVNNPVYFILETTVTDGRCFVLPGASTTYTVTVVNDGPSDAIAASVTDSLSTALTLESWTCSASAGAVCGNSSGSGSLDDRPSIPAGESVTYTVNCSVDSGATGSVTYTVNASPGTGVGNPNAGDNQATDRNALETPVFCDDFENGDKLSWSTSIF